MTALQCRTVTRQSFAFEGSVVSENKISTATDRKQSAINSKTLGPGGVVREPADAVVKAPIADTATTEKMKPLSNTDFSKAMFKASDGDSDGKPACWSVWNPPK